MAERSEAQHVDEMGEQALAEYFEANKDNPEVWQQKGRRIRARRGPSTVFQMRIAPDELEEITRAANGNVSEFMRTAALEKARHMAGKADVVETVRRRARELAEAVEQL